jgi:hypothetical protein
MVSSRSDYISGRKTIDDWKNIQSRLSGANEEIWKEICRDFFIDRLKLRYLHPIKILQENGCTGYFTHPPGKLACNGLDTRE